jgi:hypothetical protein
VSASVTVDAALHARWSAAASLAGLDRNGFAVDALKRALEGIIVADRRRSSDPVNTDERPGQGSRIRFDEMEAA